MGEEVYNPHNRTEKQGGGGGGRECINRQNIFRLSFDPIGEPTECAEKTGRDQEIIRRETGRIQTLWGCVPEFATQTAGFPGGSEHRIQNVFERNPGPERVQVGGVWDSRHILDSRPLSSQGDWGGHPGRNQGAVLPQTHQRDQPPRESHLHNRGHQDMDGIKNPIASGERCHLDVFRFGAKTRGSTELQARLDHTDQQTDHVHDSGGGESGASDRTFSDSLPRREQNPHHYRQQCLERVDLYSKWCIEGRAQGGGPQHRGGHPGTAERRSPGDGEARGGGGDNTPVLAASHGSDAAQVSVLRSGPGSICEENVPRNLGHGEKHSVSGVWWLRRGFPRRPTLLPNKKELAELPLHIKDVGAISWEVADKCVADNCEPFLGLWFSLTAPFRNVEHLGTFFKLGRVGLQQHAALTDEDIRRLMVAKRIREISPTRIKAVARAFSVVEKAKNRRRWILWPKTFNEGIRTRILDCDSAAKNICAIFPQIKEIKATAATYCYSVCLDLKSWFQQFAIRREIGEYFAFCAGGRAYAPNTIPTGAANCPLFAHILAVAIAKEACNRTRVPPNVEVFIDNFRASANNVEDLTSWIDAFFTVLGEVGAVLNETVEEALQLITSGSHVFLGMAFNKDKDGCTVQVAQKTRDKLEGFASDFRGTKAPSWEMLTWQALFGVLVFASTVLDISRAQFYYAYKFIRRKSNQQFAEEKRVKGWGSIQHVWRNWIEKATVSKTLCASRGAQQEDFAHSSVLYTDASLSGWAGVAFDKDCETIIAAKWTEKQAKIHINILELKAVRFFCEKYNGQQRVFALRIDNTTAKRQIEKGGSVSYNANEEIKKLQSCLETKGIKLIDIRYVNTKENLADHWSRIFS